MDLDTKLATMEADGLPLYLLPSQQVLAPGHRHTTGSGKAPGATSTSPHNPIIADNPTTPARGTPDGTHCVLSWSSTATLLLSSQALKKEGSRTDLRQAQVGEDDAHVKSTTSTAKRSERGTQHEQ
jgi:hypothetical protein